MSISTNSNVPGDYQEILSTKLFPEGAPSSYPSADVTDHIAAAMATSMVEATVSKNFAVV